MFGTAAAVASIFSISSPFGWWGGSATTTMTTGERKSLVRSLFNTACALSLVVSSSLPASDSAMTAPTLSQALPASTINFQGCTLWGFGAWVAASKKCSICSRVGRSPVILPMLRRLLITSNTLMISLSCLCAYCKGLHPLRGRSYAGVLLPVLTCGATLSHPQHRATIKALPSIHHPPSPLRIHAPQGRRQPLVIDHIRRCQGNYPVFLSPAAMPLIVKRTA